jgi:virginiamycin B lyase
MRAMAGRSPEEGVLRDPRADAHRSANSADHAPRLRAACLLLSGRRLAATLALAALVCLVAATQASAFVYWTDRQTNWIGRANLDGTGVNQQFVTSGVPNIRLMTVDDQHIYWGNVDGTIGRSDLNGSNVNPNFITLASAPQGVAVDDQHVYWANSNIDAIGRANIDGTGVDQSFIDNALNPVGLALDGQHIYWADAINGRIGRVDLDGQNSNDNFIATLGGLQGLAVDGQHVYWANLFTDRIGRANIDGTGVEQNFITGLSDPVGVAVDGQHVYWANNGTDTIARANLDGTGINLNFIGSFLQPQGVAVDGFLANPTLTRAASPGVQLGGQVHATAALASGQSPTGTIEFNLYGPDDPTCSTSPAFTDSVTVSGNANYDSGDFTPTQVGTYRWTAAYSGDATNAPTAGACDAANGSVTVEPRADQDPPDVTITKGPKARTRSTSAGFEFESTEPGSTFECRKYRTDKPKTQSHPFLPCDSPKTFTDLRHGRRMFEVRSTDAAGNTDPTPAMYAWKVRKG